MWEKRFQAGLVQMLLNSIPRDPGENEDEHLSRIGKRLGVASSTIYAYKSPKADNAPTLDFMLDLVDLVRFRDPQTADAIARKISAALGLATENHSAGARPQ